MGRPGKLESSLQVPGWQVSLKPQGLIWCRGQEGPSGAPGPQVDFSPPTQSLIGPPLGTAYVLVTVILQD